MELHLRRVRDRVLRRLPRGAPRDILDRDRIHRHFVFVHQPGCDRQKLSVSGLYRQRGAHREELLAQLAEGIGADDLDADLTTARHHGGHWGS